MPRVGIVAAAASPSSTPTVDIVRHRYAATVLGQAVQMASSIVSAAVVPRFLGAAEYGNFSFLLNMAANLRGFTEPSAQQAFFTLSSREEASGPLTRLYAVWVLAQLALLLSIVAGVAALGWSGWVWPGQRLDRIVLITFLDWTIFLTLSLKQLGDSKGLTVWPQMFSIAGAAAMAFGTLVLAISHALTFYTYAWLNLITAAATSAMLARWLLVVHGLTCWNGALAGKARAYIGQWWTYARPLILVEYYTPLAALFSTYLIQAWYGPREQGQLALAWRWSAAVMLFTGSATAILWREIAHAVAQGDDRKAADMFRSSSRVLLFVTMSICVWLAAGSRVLVDAIAGPDYAEAAPVLAIMAFYPLQQTFGQLNGMALKATGRTATYRNITIATSVPDIVLTYFLLAPSGARVPGLDLGAAGVAVRMVGYGLLSVQVYEWSNARHFGIGYGRLLRERAGVFAVFGMAGLALWVASRGLAIAASLQPLAAFAVCSIGYFALVAWLAVRTFGAESIRDLLPLGRGVRTE
jgi:O-antigen/teichoic acid export membrane protein